MRIYRFLDTSTLVISTLCQFDIFSRTLRHFFGQFDIFPSWSKKWRTGTEKKWRSVLEKMTNWHNVEMTNVEVSRNHYLESRTLRQLSFRQYATGGRGRCGKGRCALKIKIVGPCYFDPIMLRLHWPPLVVNWFVSWCAQWLTRQLTKQCMNRLTFFR